MGAKMLDIANRAGTSIAAVSVTLNGAKSKTLGVSPATREKILQAAEELGYRRNPLAGSLATGRTHVIGFMLPSVEGYSDHDPFYTLVANGITGAASARGYNVMLYTATAENQGLRAARMIDKRIDGLVLVSPPSSSPIYEECERQGIPVATILGDDTATGPHIKSDDYEGGKLATNHLLKLGHVKIAHLHGRFGVSTTLPREQGYKDAMSAAGSSALSVPGDFNRNTGRESTLKLMALPEGERPTAIFAANDLSAHGALDAIRECGLESPKDVAIVGYDDTWYSTVVQPTLCSIHMGVADLGRRAADLLISILEGAYIVDTHPVLPVSLVIRESSGSPRV
ncbi:MAG TPA: LacI family DNA-binding transcriptional regulator [Fimbriimonadaceae bacterium]|jgi:LacI family transcriptional regulator